MKILQTMTTVLVMCTLVDGLTEDWPGIHERDYKIKKRMGSKRAYFVRGCAAMFSRGVHMSGDLIISVDVLGRTDTDNGGRAWTVGPAIGLNISVL